MVFAIILILWTLCQILDSALEYDLAKDDAPDKLWHKIFYKISIWMTNKEELRNV